MGVFRFKRFSVVNERSAMKVNTDGVLLGAAMTISEDDIRLLDVGTGTGTVALMAVQRMSGFNSSGYREDFIVSGVSGYHEGQKEIKVDAIDIDEPSATEASCNFKSSPWDACLSSYNMSLEEFAQTYPERKYDLIFSNPPYFEDSLTAPDERKSTARHTSDGLSYRDIFDYAQTHLTEDGRVSLVLPAEQENGLCRYARMSGMHLFRIMRIRTVPRKAPIRIIAEFSRKRCEDPEECMLTIQNEGKYTSEYLSLTRDFYLFA